MIITVKDADFSACGIGKIITTISDECKKIASHYQKLKTVEDMGALQQFMDDLGYGVKNGIWNKAIFMTLPVFSSTLNEWEYDVIGDRLIYASGNNNGIIVEAVSPWGVKNIGSKSPWCEVSCETIKATEIIDLCALKGPTNVQAAIVNATEGVVNTGELLSVAVSLKNDTTYQISIMNPSLFVLGKWVEANEALETGKYKLWFDGGNKVSGDLSVDTINRNLTSVRASYGGAYIGPASDSINYIDACFRGLSETECQTLANATSTFFKNLGLSA